MVDRYIISKGLEVQRREAAELFILELLNGNLPSQNYFEVLYGLEKIKFAQKKVDNFIEHEILPILSDGKSVRNLTDITKSEIFIKKNQMSARPLFREMDFELTNWRIPSAESFKELFGPYSEKVKLNFKTFNDLKKIRKCGLPYSKHLLRVAINADEIGFDNKSGKPEFYYRAIWGLHDSVEELPYSIKDSDKSLIYGLVNLKKFLLDFIPLEMHADIMMLTNKSDLIIKYLKAEGYPTSNESKLKTSLDSLKQEKGISYLFEDINKMSQVLSDGVYCTPGEDFFEAMKWACYEKIFINELGEEAYAKKHLALFEGKGILDLFDNFTARQSTRLDERIRSILKIELWEKKAEEIVERAKINGESYPFFESKVVELMNQANYGALEMAINYISQPISTLDHLNAGLSSIKQMKGVLYTSKNAI
ncbi:MAG: hypothetical protein WC758_01470 [Candidatus Woesearchaeota archaeon]|jgi:hypothetical protein